MRYLLPTALLLGLCSAPALAAPGYLEASHLRCKDHALQTGCLLVETEAGSKIFQTYGSRGDFIEVVLGDVDGDADHGDDFLACTRKGGFGCDWSALYDAERRSAEARAAERAVGILPAFAAATVSCPDNQRERDGRCFPRRFTDGWRFQDPNGDPESGRNGGSERAEREPGRTPDRPSAPDREPEAPVSEPEPAPSEPTPCV